MKGGMFGKRASPEQNQSVVPRRAVSGHETVEINCAGGAGGLLVFLFSYIAVTKPIIQ